MLYQETSGNPAADESGIGRKFGVLVRPKLWRLKALEKLKILWPK
jgi:hypothetical protein